jgi:ubiquinone/menaquinone biosynthesis C-methylase UbiE
VSSPRDYWDAQAAAFDEEPDHGLRDPEVRRTWRALLRRHLPAAPARIADLGCGTGSLAVLLAEDGHDVHGIDLSDRMVARARDKAAAAGVDVTFTPGDAADPELPPSSCDVVLARHVLWALPDPAAALARWVGLLRPEGRLVLVEGRWSTGAGLTAQQCISLVLQHRQQTVVHLLDDPGYWGRRVDDERYLLLSER